MNAHTRPPRRVPDKTPIQKLILDAGRLVSLAGSIGALTSAEQADQQAAHLEGAARNMGATAAHPSNQVDQLLFLEVAGDYAKRARLYRDRARELRS